MGVEDILYVAGIILAVAGTWNLTSKTKSPAELDAALQNDLGVSQLIVELRDGGMLAWAKTYGLVLLGLLISFSPEIAGSLGLLEK